MRVIIYMGNELQMDATLEFDPTYDRWMALSAERSSLDGSEANSN
jgi:hypothetical protein